MLKLENDPDFLAGTIPATVRVDALRDVLVLFYVFLWLNHQVARVFVYCLFQSRWSLWPDFGDVCEEDKISLAARKAAVERSLAAQRSSRKKCVS